AHATVSPFSELAKVAVEEKLLLEECFKHFAVISRLEIEERSLRLKNKEKATKMNDLFSSSFKQDYPDDIEAGGGAGNDAIDLEKFFQDVENVKDDMVGVEKLYRKLQESNDESRTIHNAKTMKQLRTKMDSDVELVLKRVITPRVFGSLTSSIKSQYTFCILRVYFKS
nr:syntaxin-124 like [Tanacetum cinerariifolium]